MELVDQSLESFEDSGKLLKMDIPEYQMFANTFGYIFHHNCIFEGSRILLLTLP
jgi:hypothetical protein